MRCTICHEEIVGVSFKREYTISRKSGLVEPPKTYKLHFCRFCCVELISYLIDHLDQTTYHNFVENNGTHIQSRGDEDNNPKKGKSNVR